MSGDLYAVNDDARVRLLFSGTRGECVDFVRRLAAMNGMSAVRDLSLGRWTANDEYLDVVAGDDLVAVIGSP